MVPSDQDRVRQPDARGPRRRTRTVESHAQKCVTTWVRSWSRGGRVPPERWVTKEGTAVKNAELIAAVADLLDHRTVTWSKVKSHATLTTPEHLLNREADARAGAVVAALHAGTPPVTGPGWTG
jgi:ribonuclease HI